MLLRNYLLYFFYGHLEISKQNSFQKITEFAPKMAQFCVLNLDQDLYCVVFYKAIAGGGVGQLGAVDIRPYHQGWGLT